jgi:hypothetical protein
MALSEPVKGLIIFPNCLLLVRSSVGLTHIICQLNTWAAQVKRIKSMLLQMTREHENLYQIEICYPTKYQNSGKQTAGTEEIDS